MTICSYNIICTSSCVYRKIVSNVLFVVDMTFTRKNVHRAVWTVENTDHLGRYLSVPRSKQDEIERQFSSESQQVKEVYINYFMDHDPLASWRRIIVVLDAIREKEAADNIRHLAERVTGRADS